MSKTFRLTFAVSFFTLGMMVYHWVDGPNQLIPAMIYGGALALFAVEIFGNRSLPRMPPDDLLAKLEKYRNDSYPELRIYTAIRLWQQWRRL